MVYWANPSALLHTEKLEELRNMVVLKNGQLIISWDMVLKQARGLKWKDHLDVSFLPVESIVNGGYYFQWAREATYSMILD